MTEDYIACYSDKGWLLSDIYIHHILSAKIKIYILPPETMCILSLFIILSFPYKYLYLCQVVHLYGLLPYLYET